MPEPKTDHVANLHAAAKRAGLQASRGELGWQIHETESGMRLTAPEASLDAQQAAAWVDGWHARELREVARDM